VALSAAVEENILSYEPVVTQECKFSSCSLAIHCAKQSWIIYYVIILRKSCLAVQMRRS